MKKWISVLLVFCLLLSVAMPAFAQEETDVSAPVLLTECEIEDEDETGKVGYGNDDEETPPEEEPSEEEPPEETPSEEVPSEEEPSEEPRPAGKNDIVANMYLCFRWSKDSPMGHVWIYIENLSNETLEVGAYRLPPEQGVSIGSFGLRSDAVGTHYNVEAYCASVFGMSGMMAMRDTLTKSELSSVSKAILNFNFWGFILNCAVFAAVVWNAGSNKKVIPFLFSFVIQLQILLYGNIGEIQMYKPERDQVLKQKGIGSRATLAGVSNGPISKQI